MPWTDTHYTLWEQLVEKGFAVTCSFWSDQSAAGRGGDTQLHCDMWDMEAGDLGNVRQYGGYGGGFVECCEGVVDPILLLGIIAGITHQWPGTGCNFVTFGKYFISALAGLTFFLQQQVVMFINGGRRFGPSEDENLETYFNQISNILDVNDVFEVGTWDNPILSI